MGYVSKVGLYEFLLSTRKIKKLFFRENVATWFKLKASQQEAKTQWGLCLVSWWSMLEGAPSRIPLLPRDNRTAANLHSETAQSLAGRVFERHYKNVWSWSFCSFPCYKFGFWGLVADVEENPLKLLKFCFIWTSRGWLFVQGERKHVPQGVACFPFWFKTLF